MAVRSTSASTEAPAAGSAVRPVRAATALAGLRCDPHHADRPFASTPCQRVRGAAGSPRCPSKNTVAPPQHYRLRRCHHRHDHHHRRPLPPLPRDACDSHHVRWATNARTLTWFDPVEDRAMPGADRPEELPKQPPVSARHRADARKAPPREHGPRASATCPTYTMGREHQRPRLLSTHRLGLRRWGCTDRPAFRGRELRENVNGDPL